MNLKEVAPPIPYTGENLKEFMRVAAIVMFATDDLTDQLKGNPYSGGTTELAQAAEAGWAFWQELRKSSNITISSVQMAMPLEVLEEMPEEEQRGFLVWEGGLSKDTTFARRITFPLYKLVESYLQHSRYYQQIDSMANVFKYVKEDVQKFVAASGKSEDVIRYTAQLAYIRHVEATMSQDFRQPGARDLFQLIKRCITVDIEQAISAVDPYEQNEHPITPP